MNPRIPLDVPLEAVRLRPGRWAVSPEGRPGTCGWLDDGRPWTVVYVNAPSAERALTELRREVKAA